MAIRNDKLGGSDFVNGEVLYDYDLDDTNNALIEIAAKGVAQSAYQTLKHAGTFDNKDNLGADRFTDANGVNNTVGGLFNTEYDGVNNNFSIDFDFYYVIIVAGSLNMPDFEINNCLIKNLGNGKWLLYSTESGIGLQKAQIFKTLFSGNTPTIEGITGLSEIKSSDVNDVGCRVSYLSLDASSFTNTIDEIARTTINFDNTTTNDSVESWSDCNSGFLGGSNYLARWEIPLGTTRNIDDSSVAGSDEIGTDTSTDTVSNPNDARMTVQTDGTGARPAVQVFIKHKDSLTITETNNTELDINRSYKDFTVDSSVPLFTEATEIFPNTVLCNSNLLTLTGNEKSICVYSDEVNTANTNITYNVSDGTTTINDLEFNTVNGIASLGSGQMEITFNLSTTDTSESPELYGYSYYIY